MSTNCFATVWFSSNQLHQNFHISSAEVLEIVVPQNRLSVRFGEPERAIRVWSKYVHIQVDFCR
jgi:hypothetical protein